MTTGKWWKRRSFDVSFDLFMTSSLVNSWEIDSWRPACVAAVLYHPWQHDSQILTLPVKLAQRFPSTFVMGGEAVVCCGGMRNDLDTWAVHLPFHPRQERSKRLRSASLLFPSGSRPLSSPFLPAIHLTAHLNSVQAARREARVLPVSISTVSFSWVHWVSPG